MKKVYSVHNDFINTRLDRWFKKNVIEIPQSLIEKSIRKGKIKVNNKKEKSSYKLKKNDEIYVIDINFEERKIKQKLDRYIPTKKDIKYSSNLFIENNENFAIINKPNGIAVQPGTKSKRNILDILKGTKEFYGYQPFSVHRIDKETSGVLIVAKNRNYAKLFTSLFRIRKIYKLYIAIVLGEFDKKKGVFLDELISYENKKKIIYKAYTDYKVIDSNNNYSLLELKPKTGRKHQLRKQLVFRGHPVLGDSKYRLKEDYSKKKSNLMLHAYKISFLINNIKYNYVADMPKHFKNTLIEKYLKIPL